MTAGSQLASHPVVLSRADVEDMLEMKDAVEAVERAQIQAARGTAVMPLRIATPVAEADGVHVMMPAYLPEEHALGFKSASAFRRNPEHGLPLVDAMIVLLDPTNGRLLAVMDGVHITTVRTAAASAVATRALATEDATRLALVGAGVQAGSHLEAMIAVREIQEVRVAARTRESAAAFAAAASKRHPELAIDAASTVRDAVADADVVCTVSTATEPVLRRDWLREGCHVNAVGSHSPSAREIDGETMRVARVVVDSRAAALGECGDCMIPLAEGLFDAAHVSDEIGEILIGSKQGRRDASQITVYQSCGIAVQDVATAALVHQRAVLAGRGSSIEGLGV